VLRGEGSRSGRSGYELWLLCTTDDLVLHTKPAHQSRRRAIRLTGRLASLVQEQEEQHLRRILPTGFILHESRAGSTLLANMLASSHRNLVYSEPHPPAAILGCQ
jgi:hypothetical protein